jgi:hypothetical protein
MKPTFLFLCSSHNNVALLGLRGAVAVALSLACGDDSSSQPPASVRSASAKLPANNIDAGLSSSGSAELTQPQATETQATGAVASGTSSATPAGVACENIATQCAEYDDTDGLGHLCLRLASENSVESCDAIADECSAYCRADGVEPEASVETSTLDAESCDEAIGDPCHEFDHGTGLGHVCHQLGHQGNIPGCVALYDECVALCGGAEPGEEHVSDAGSESSSDASVNDAATH